MLMGNWGQAESVGVRWPPRAARTMFTAPALGAIHDESARRAANRVGSVAIRLNVNIVSSQCSTARGSFESETVRLPGATRTGARDTRSSPAGALLLDGAYLEL